MIKKNGNFKNNIQRFLLLNPEFLAGVLNGD